MDSSLVTLAVVPRERFSFAERSLEDICRHTPSDVELIYIDGNSPSTDWVPSVCHNRKLNLIRRPDYLTPNVARNLAAEHVRTKYVAFIDNDVLTSPGWLEKLVACAEETDAWAVGPLYCQGEPVGEEVHMAGGRAHFYEEGGRRFFFESHTSWGKPVHEIVPQLQTGPVELIEFHMMLLRMDAFEEYGKLDEGYLSVHEHVDICLTLNEANRGVFMVPDSVVSYVGPTPLTPSDREYFQLRWYVTPGTR